MSCGKGEPTEHILIFITQCEYEHIYIYMSPPSMIIQSDMGCLALSIKSKREGKSVETPPPSSVPQRRYLSTRDLNHEQVRARACIYMHTLLYTTKVFLRRDAIQTRQRDLRICHERSTDKF